MLIIFINLLLLYLIILYLILTKIINLRERLLCNIDLQIVIKHSLSLSIFICCLVLINHKYNQYLQEKSTETALIQRY